MQSLITLALFVAFVLWNAAPADADLVETWDRNFTAAQENLRLEAAAWDSVAAELVLSISSTPGAERSQTRRALWRIDADGERIRELPLPEGLHRTMRSGLVIGAEGPILVAETDQGLEVVRLNRGGELKSRHRLSGEAGDIEPIETLLLADGTVVLAGTLDSAAVVFASPGDTPSVTRITTDGVGAVLDVAPARGGSVLALVHSRENAEPMFVFESGEIHVALLGRDGHLRHRVRMEGRLGCVLDTGTGYAAMLDLGERRRQEWWLVRFDDELREVFRLRVSGVESTAMPRQGQLVSGPGAGFTGIVAGAHGRPRVVSFSSRGTLLTSGSEVGNAGGPGFSQPRAIAGGTALYLVAPGFVEDAGEVRDTVRVMKLGN